MPEDNDFEGLEGPVDPFDIVHEAHFEDGELVRYSQTELSEDARSEEKERADKRIDEPPVGRRDPSDPANKVHPELEEWRRLRGADEAERLIITFRDELAMPRFPEPDIDEPRDSDRNRRELGRAAELIEMIQARRADDYGSLTERLAEYEAEVVETFWLIRAVCVEAPLRAVDNLVEDEEVLYIEPEQTSDQPPVNDVVDGREDMRTDPYFDLGLDAGWFGLLDTGVRDTHVLFNSPRRIALLRDCVNGGADCNTGPNLNPADDCWNHGTSSAAILSANSRQGNDFRGVTAIMVDSWKVYPSSFDGNGRCNGGLNATAAVRGFQNSVRWLARVIVAEMQGSGNEQSVICRAADAAFDAGAVVVAANGNFGPTAGTVRTPAIAHKVIGVGNYDVTNGNQITSQSRGPATDGRWKPDIQAPTNTDTASAASDTARRNFGGTSGATPYAAGAAALLRNWLRRPTGSIDPGQVCAQMILSGQQPWPFDNTSGAGRIECPTDGVAWWGKVTVLDGSVIDIPITVTSRRARDLDAALWWPEGGVRIFGFHLDWHSDVDLHLIDPAGVTRDSSISGVSVFERARAAGQVDRGTWILRIRGFRVPLFPPTVYWAAHVRTR